jgi:hypothetical protein
MVDRAAAAKLEILVEILALARAQRDALEEDQFDRFDTLLNERDALIERLAVLVEEGELPDNIVSFTGHSDAAVQDALALDVVITGIVTQDRANEETLAAKMAVIREQFPAIENGRRAAAGYRMAANAGASFVDRTS